MWPLRSPLFVRNAALIRLSTAVAWVGGHTAVTCPIVGARNVDQLMPALGATEIDMTPDLWSEIAALSRTPAVATDRSEEAG